MVSAYGWSRDNGLTACDQRGCRACIPIPASTLTVPSPRLVRCYTVHVRVRMQSSQLSTKQCTQMIPMPCQGAQGLRSLILGRGWCHLDVCQLTQMVRMPGAFHRSMGHISLPQDCPLNS
ncbi:hypothetical protein PV05_07425 [Exophiala xenobiotica]|uniref:Uncharacterized protein n=1 Tax=Exophiala xenobiotica TaxID=348802 RepID=A0A0D2EIA0_9EURO|nr:uncharacterized protein PV05_07425 [Exophiala xenobiotica]KIW55118.1 hypothetical protein PV05_07425 [Exophiala xenobiotica]